MGFRNIARLVLLALVMTASLVVLSWAGNLPPLRVSENHRFLVTDDGKPFFYMADTAWELFHRLDRRQAVDYLDSRAAQHFNVIQAVALSELDGVRVPNAYGKQPLIDLDPAKPAVTPGADPTNPSEYDYWDHVDFIVDEANARGIYVAMLPSWGRWVNDEGDTILTPQNAQTYGEFLGRRFGKKGVIWILGGDRDAKGHEATWRALARGIAIGVSGTEDYGAVLMSFHPGGGQTSSSWFQADSWLSFNMQQDGHNQPWVSQSWKAVTADYSRTPIKPVIDGEPLYEDHPLAFNAKEFGYSFDAHVRQYAYADVFSGACGHTYGNHAVWQMYAPGRQAINGPLMYWFEAIRRPGAAEMQYLRALMESRPYLSRVPDQSLIVDPQQGADRISATRGDGYALIYSAQGRRFSVRMGKVSGDSLRGWWFNPRSGDAVEFGTFPNSGTHDFTPPSEGFGSDWVLVLDDGSKKFLAPGKYEAK